MIGLTCVVHVQKINQLVKCFIISSDRWPLQKTVNKSEQPCMCLCIQIKLKEVTLVLIKI